MPMSDHAQWRRWQPDNLLQEAAEITVEIDSTASEAQRQADLARLRKQAEQQGFSQGMKQGEEAGQQQGYEAGWREGHEAGLAQGIEQAAAQQQALLRQAECWLQNFRLARENLDSVIPGRLVQLALTAVQQLYGRQAQIDHPALLQQIRQLLQHDALLHGTIQLYVHPDDRAVIEQALAQALTETGWQLHSDAQLAPGGCRITSAESEFDASLETRWQALCQLARQEIVP
ncbi:flagellar assembly protein FliH [Pantoea sp. JGM49]|uniref:flagellar assembly protein FliH n=1 Tax=unclassified Pantoea TaxID=2630326 RepID=UPI00132BD39C|nr:MULTISPECIES: flagellar assembly protein FliH [unclassified Pantoea]MBS0882955.1 flagellar assembly protein FliH [Pantoea sp. JGM49]MXP54485.1 flagellar assembly protein FliH [Pantoea sp. Seng]